MESVVGSGPSYDLKETETDVVLSVVAPLCKPSDVTVLLDNKVITFEAPPYYLKLKLPCHVSETQNEDRFDESTGVYTLVMKKRLGTSEDRDSGSDEEDDDSFEELTKCLAEAKITGSAVPSSGDKPTYGFLNMYSGIFGDYYREFSQVINLPDPDRTKVEDRKCLKRKEEKEKWNEDHYLADLMETEHLIPLFKYKCPWSCASSAGVFNREEEEIISCIQRCERLERCNLSDDERRLATCQMVDVLLGYCYNKRTTEGDNTVESAWTINKLSSTLSWLEVVTSLKRVVVSFYRRSLTYPLYRNWELTKRVHADVVELLRSGPVWVTRCLIETKELFDNSDNRHILNMLYVNQLCHYARSQTPDALNETAEELEKIRVEKKDVHEDLDVLEMAARVALEEEANGSDVDDLTNRVSGLSVEEVAAAAAAATTTTSGTEESSSSESEDAEGATTSSSESVDGDTESTTSSTD